MLDVPVPCLVTEVVTAAPAIGQTVPGVVTNIGGRDEETSPAQITIFTSLIVLYGERREEINDLKFIKKKFLK